MNCGMHAIHSRKTTASHIALIVYYFTLSFHVFKTHHSTNHSNYELQLLVLNATSMRATPEHLRGVFTMRRYTNPCYLTLPYCQILLQTLALFFSISYAQQCFFLFLFIYFCFIPRSRRAGRMSVSFLPQVNMLTLSSSHAVLLYGLANVLLTRLTWQADGSFSSLRLQSSSPSLTTSR